MKCHPGQQQEASQLAHHNLQLELLSLVHTHIHNDGLVRRMAEVSARGRVEIKEQEDGGEKEGKVCYIAKRVCIMRLA